MCVLPINNPALMQPINRLTRAGLQVLGVNTRFKRPIIEVDRPFLAWEQRAVSITERENGVYRTAKMMVWRNVRVIWR